MNTKRLLDGGQYTPSKDMGPDYLARKFARIRKELAAKQAAAIPSDDSKRKTLRAVGGRKE